MDATVRHHITLQERFDVLFRRTKRTREQLLAFLNLGSNGTISNWFKNDEVPRHRIERVAQFFGVELEILNCRDHQTFNELLLDLGPTLGRRWDVFVGVAKTDPDLFGVVRLNGGNNERTIQEPSWIRAPDRMMEVQVSDRIKFRIHRVLVQGLGIGHAHHVCIMAKDRLGWGLLAPDLAQDDFAPDNWHSERIYLDLPARRSGLRFSRNGVVQSYALVTSKAIPVEFLQQMAKGQNFLAAAERVVRWIETSDMRYSLLGCEFLCFHGRPP